MPTVVDAVACAEVLDDLAEQRAALELEQAEALDVGDVHRARCAVVAELEVDELAEAEARALRELEAAVLP